VSRRPRCGSITFRPRARILKLIGEELISDDVVAVSELVKNAHDADALLVTGSFRGVTGPDGEIVVRDDGCGMDRETLLGRWMEPAASSKLRADRNVTPRGRRVLGEKGVGRFAADKLAGSREMLSRPEDGPRLPCRSLNDSPRKARVAGDVRGGCVKSLKVSFGNSQPWLVHLTYQMSRLEPGMVRPSRNSSRRTPMPS